MLKEEGAFLKLGFCSLHFVTCPDSSFLPQPKVPEEFPEEFPEEVPEEVPKEAKN